MTAPDRNAAWWEEYRCGCVSENVAERSLLVGYCGRHGESRRMVHREIEDDQ